MAWYNSDLTSGGTDESTEVLQNELLSVKDTLGYVATKNLLEITATTTTKNGVTFTVNDDGGITVNGTATETTAFKFAENIALPNGEYILNGCPNGASVGTYYLYMTGTGISGHDDGAGKTFVIEDNVISDISIYVVSEQTVNNVTFYPMIRKSDEPDKRDVNVRLNSTPKIEFKSYTGTGKYGSSNPTSVTFSFTPMIVMMVAVNNPTNSYNIGFNGTLSRQIMTINELSTTYGLGLGFCCDVNSQTNVSNQCYGKKSSDGKTIYWYTGYNSSSWGPVYQCNDSNTTYYLLAIG